jgi:hypothetical protein
MGDTTFTGLGFLPFPDCSGLPDLLQRRRRTCGKKCGPVESRSREYNSRVASGPAPDKNFAAATFADTQAWRPVVMCRTFRLPLAPTDAAGVKQVGERHGVHRHTAPCAAFACGRRIM